MEDLWGEEPDWFQDDDDNDDDGKEKSHSQPGSSSANDDENDDNDAFSLPTPAQHCLVLLDCHVSMFEPVPLTSPRARTRTRTRVADLNKSDQHEECGEEKSSMRSTSAVEIALKCCETLVREKIRVTVTTKTSKRDGFGVLLFNTRYRRPLIQRELPVEPTTRTRERGNQNEDNDASHDIANADEEDSDDDDDDMSESMIPRTTVHEFLPLQPPGVHTVRKIRSAWKATKLSGATTFQTFQTAGVDLQHEYTENADFQHDHNNGNNDNDSLTATANTTMQELQRTSLQQALHQGLQWFRKAKCVHFEKRQTASGVSKPDDIKQIWIFTNQDDPLRLRGAATSESSERNEKILEIVHTTVNDLREYDINLLVWPLPRRATKTDAAGVLFHYDYFYKTIGASMPFAHENDDDDDNDVDDDRQAGSTTDVLRVNDYWQKLIQLPAASEEVGYEDSDENALWHDIVLDHFFSQYVWKHTRPSYRGIPLLLPDWRNHDPQPPPGIMVDFYKMVQLHKPPTPVKVHQETGKVLSRLRQVATSGGGDILLEQKSGAAAFRGAATTETMSLTRPVAAQDRLRTYVEFGGVHVPMSLQDKVALKRAANANPEYASLILLGFQKAHTKPNNLISLVHTLEHAYLLYPHDGDDEETKPGTAVSDRTKMSSRKSSTSAFAHLQAGMLRKGVIAIGELLTRITGTSRLVALFPLAAEIGVAYDLNDTHQDSEKRPDGLVLISLPFEDEIRAQEPDAACQAWEQTSTSLASNELVDAAVQLIEKQTLPDAVIGEDFENAYLNRFWDYVEHAALEEAAPPSRTYDTEVSADVIRQVAGQEIDRFASLLPLDVKAEGVKKRTRQIEPDDSGIDWETLYLEDRLAECKVADLKKKLRSVGGILSGKKQDLVLRVAKHVEKEVAASRKIKSEA